MEELYFDLLNIVKSGEYPTVFYKDVLSPLGTPMRIFSYHGNLPYEFWELPSALECRGVMFYMDGETPLGIASRPMCKFFNYGEPNQDFTGSEIKEVFEKLDGSLISSYIDSSMLMFKSKGSTVSMQAIGAEQFMFDYDQTEFRAEVKRLAELGYTFNFEYVAPDNQVVVAYPERRLVLLNVRNNETGEYVPFDDLFMNSKLRPYLVKRIKVESSIEDFVGSAQYESDIEGYIVNTSDDKTFKIKTSWYSELHYIKDLIFKESELNELIVQGSADDLKSMQLGAEVKELIERAEVKFYNYLTSALKLIELAKQYRGLPRVDFYNKVTSILVENKVPELISIIMRTYQENQDPEARIAEIGAVYLKVNK